VRGITILKVAFGFAAVLLLGATTASATTVTFPQCPATGNDMNGCELLITVTAINGSGAATAFSVATESPDEGPFDGNDDTLIGITNSARGTLTSIFLSGGAGSGAFHFDGDGACTGTYTAISFGPAPAQCPGSAFTSTDPADYGSAGASFSGICGGSHDCGTVNVSLANGASTWFDLEGKITATQISGVPEPGTLVLFGSGLLGLAGLVHRKLKI
jgi:hypothetical protein